MRALRAVAVGTLVLLAALAQGSLVARLPWPGSGEPQLAALVVIAVALAAGARVGAATGFGAGLLLDLLPPAAHPLGQWAFVLCLLGYLLGALAADVSHSLLLTIGVSAVAAALAPFAFALVGQLLGDPRADLLGAAARLPTVALWTLLLAPLLLTPLRWRRPREVGPAAPAAAWIPLAVR